jgi:ribosomal protein S18 acetylase RimI-like enzyme
MDIQQVWPKEKDFVLGAVQDRCVFGSIYIREDGFLYNFNVHKSCRRAGIGSDILSHTIDWARTKSMEEVWLTVKKDNLPAQSLYNKFGFVYAEVQTCEECDNESIVLRLPLERNSK